MKETKMNPEVKQRWLEALRSGKYQQTTKTLRGPLFTEEWEETGETGHCCLGVLTDILNGWAGVSGAGSSYLPEAVAKASGLPYAKQNCKTGGAGIQGLLAQMNDAGQSFEMIADYIEANL